MRKTGPFVDDYLNSKGTRLKADLPREFTEEDKLPKLHPMERVLRTFIERTKVRIDNCQDPETLSLLQRRLTLAEARLLAHKLST